MEKLLQDCWDLLRQNTNLYIAPVILLFSGLLIENSGFSTPEMIGIGTVIMINLAISAGWINQIKVVILEKRKSNFDDLFEGIGRFFGNILMGNIFLILLITSFFLIFMSLSGIFVELSDPMVNQLSQVFEKVKNLKQEEVSSFILNLNPEIKNLIGKVGMVFLSFLTFSGLFYFFISLWAQCLIINELSWYASWKKSISLIASNLFKYSILSIVETIVFSIILVLTLLIKDPVSQIVLLVFNIISKTYFMVLFSLFVLKFDKNRKVETLANDLQSSVS